MSTIDNPDLAKRLARAILSDVAMYNPEKVENGIKNDNIFDVLKEELDEGRQHFYSRVSPDLNPDSIYDIAVVDVLIKRAGKIESSIW
jgi:predicted NBD/HSP70 family sugar kinase